MNKNLLFVLGLFLIILVGGIIVLNSNNQSSPVSTPTLAPAGQPSASLPQTGEVQKVTVTGSEYSFSPSSISVKSGDKVEITFKNAGRLSHNLTINELGVSTDTISGGQSTTVSFTAAKTGSFAMYCSVGNHRGLGMEGKVEVK